MASEKEVLAEIDSYWHDAMQEDVMSMLQDPVILRAYEEATEEDASLDAFLDELGDKYTDDILVIVFNLLSK